MSEDERKSIALHESSHVTVAWAEGIGIKRVTIKGPLEKEGSKKWRATPYYCQLKKPNLEAFGQISDDAFLSEILVSLAPWAVEEKLYGELSMSTFNDVLDLMDFLAWPVHRNSLIQDCVESAKRAIAENPDDRERQALQFYEDQKSHAMKLLNPQIMSGIESVASLLVERGSLSGFEVVLHLEEVFGESLPAKALPAKEHYCPPVGYSPEAALGSSLKLLKMIMQILSEGDATGENVSLERAREIILESIFLLSEISAGGGSCVGAARVHVSSENPGDEPRGS